MILSFEMLILQRLSVALLRSSGARAITLFSCCYRKQKKMSENIWNKLRTGPDALSSIEQVLKGKESNISGKLHGVEAKFRVIEAIQNNDIAVIRKLLRTGVDPNMRDDGNRPVFFMVCSLGYLGVLSEFLNNNVNVNESCSDGLTALHVAVKKGQVDVVKLLLLSGASMTSKTLSSLEPIDLAEYGSEIWEILRDAYDGFFPQLTSPEFKELEIIQNSTKTPEVKEKPKKKKKKKKATTDSKTNDKGAGKKKK